MSAGPMPGIILAESVQRKYDYIILEILLLFIIIIFMCILINYNNVTVLEHYFPFRVPFLLI